MTTPIRTSGHVALLALLVAVLAGCAGADQTGADPAAESTVEETAGEEMSREEMDVTELSLPATGVLGVADVEGGCTFVEIDGERFQLMAATDADVVVDPANGVVATTAGEVIAEAGDTITVDGDVDPGMVTFCQMGPVLVATSIEAG